MADSDSSETVTLADLKPSPPVTDRGVEFGIHWLAFTAWSSPGDVAEMLGRLVGFTGGIEAFEILPHGARGFRQIGIGPGGVRLYMLPVSGEGFCSVEIPGDVAKSIKADQLRAELNGLENRWQATRLDLAFDHDLYRPKDVFAAVMEGAVRSLAKRTTLKEIWVPFMGGHTVYFGSRQSERMIRVYLRDGRTRTELESKGDRADAILRDLLGRDPGEWAKRALAHLRDYVDFARDWWARFCGEVERAHMTLGKWAEESFERSRAWLENQAASSLAMLEDIVGRAAVLDLVSAGRKKYRARHKAILAACKAGPGAVGPRRGAAPGRLAIHLGEVGLGNCGAG